SRPRESGVPSSLLDRPALAQAAHRGADLGGTPCIDPFLADVEAGAREVGRLRRIDAIEAHEVNAVSRRAAHPGADGLLREAIAELLAERAREVGDAPAAVPMAAGEPVAEPFGCGASCERGGELVGARGRFGIAARDEHVGEVHALGRGPALAMLFEPR